MRRMQGSIRPRRDAESLDNALTADNEGVDMAEVIRQRRQELGLSQADLATAAGVDRRQIGRYEAGDAQPTLLVARALARALGITIDVLAGDPSFKQVLGAWWMAWSSQQAPDEVSVQAVEIRSRGMDLEIAITEPTDSGLPADWRGPMYVTRGGGLTGMFTSEIVNGSLVLDWAEASLAGLWVALPGRHGFDSGLVALGRTREDCLRALSAMSRQD